MYRPQCIDILSIQENELFQIHEHMRVIGPHALISHPLIRRQSEQLALLVKELHAGTMELCQRMELIVMGEVRLDQLRSGGSGWGLR